MVQGVGRSHADPDFESTRGEPQPGLRVRHREAFSDWAADDFASSEDPARDSLRIGRAPRHIYVLPRELEMPGRIPARGTPDHGHINWRELHGRTAAAHHRILSILNEGE